MLFVPLILASSVVLMRRFGAYRQIKKELANPVSNPAFPPIKLRQVKGWGLPFPEAALALFILVFARFTTASGNAEIFGMAGLNSVQLQLLGGLTVLILVVLTVLLNQISINNSYGELMLAVQILLCLITPSMYWSAFIPYLLLLMLLPWVTAFRRRGARKAIRAQNAAQLTT
ncbi:hypothetical protein [Corynebacterium caspium]|uniref:hypothetical protein n=1 Tax=Corynebacterium caspium TaxID=234828 RepID=UPI00036D8698|nr:hypothetical protein [Corynebacterium caspium]WKD58804.1 hypothetical protein CCASP_01945 [Corynebacterium caspium DSM 44850]